MWYPLLTSRNSTRRVLLGHLNIPSVRCGFLHPQCRRNNSYQPLRSITESDVQNLKVILEEDRLSSKVMLTSIEDTHPYLSDWTGQYRASADTGIVAVAQPTTVQQVAQIVTYCHDEGIGVVPVGGRTGLVAGAIPCLHASSARELLLSTKRLLRFDPDVEEMVRDGAFQGSSTNSDVHFNPMNGILQCGAGHTLYELQEFVKPYNYMIPLDIGSKGSCCIGGNIATNAGGQYYYRYHSLAASVLGLQVVTGTGDILDCNYRSSNLKDNTGYKLHQLVIGSEGTLGIITGVSILCQPYLASRHTMLVVMYFKQHHHQKSSQTTCTDQDMMKEILNIVNVAKSHLGEVLAAVEWMDPNSVRCVSQAFPNLKLPSLLQIPNGEAIISFPHLILIETHGTREDHDHEKRDAFLDAFMKIAGIDEEGSLSSSLIIHKDVKVARNQSDGSLFWSIRESANPATAQFGYTYKYDISIPNSNFASIMELLHDQLADYHHRIVISNWGHILDGNLHLNITDVNNFQRDDVLFSMIEPFIYEQVVRLGGSISAEHGLGQVKNHYMGGIHSPVMIRLMRSIKQVFDPKGILNPGKVLPRFEI